MDIHRPGVEEWQAFRYLRLAGLRDTPEAFGETLDHAEGCDEDDWRGRLGRFQGANALGLVGVAGDGTWTSTMRVEVTDTDAWLYGVYVQPEFRRAGVAQLLLDAVIDWSAPRATRMLLHVATDNTRARRLYDRNGFVATGASTSNPAHAHVVEIEMVRPLRTQGRSRHCADG